MLKHDNWYKLTTKNGVFRVKYLGTKWCKFQGKFSILVESEDGVITDLELDAVLSIV